MNRMKIIALVFSLTFLIILLIPAILVLFVNEPKELVLSEGTQQEGEVKTLNLEESTVAIKVYRSNQKEIETVPLEEYIVGVVASEMPVNFELEALKAQALAARTFIVKQLLSNQRDSVPEGADVTDTQNHQVYSSQEELKTKWGKQYQENIQKITEAVAATQGQILTFNDQPIYAAFFSTSNGKTQNSESYWENELPYLKSVDSSWDSQSPQFLDRKVFSIDQFEQLLGVEITADSAGEIVGKTEGGYVEAVNINGKKLTGRKIREQLGLKSSDFSWVVNGDEVVVETKGYGHGVGMSQYGAHFMAQEGKTYNEIINHYYKGVAINNADPLLTAYIETAKK
ncbi:stage II sporulation protein D [Bacillus carboniphilus]|uniref:Stage II sporulation protein D n=1 Tax=Bacillus carboniphilus TaxID=86663 RepID=A0ABY9JT68_9BACI|nr:stage II sporulation protein D [Bacillus carboniphilus]WLR41625.1 stage II sporulation protein D [Bacillus carboniphilus]